MKIIGSSALSHLHVFLFQSFTHAMRTTMLCRSVVSTGRNYQAWIMRFLTPAWVEKASIDRLISSCTIPIR